MRVNSNRLLLIKSLFIIFLSFTLFLTCGPSDSTDNPYMHLFELEGGKLPFYESAKNTTPVIKDKNSRYKIDYDPNDSTFSVGIPPYEIFATLRDFDPEIHHGIVDNTNLYKILYNLSDYYKDEIKKLAQLNAEDTTAFDSTFFADTSINVDSIFKFTSDSTFPVISPFDFGTEDKCYSYVTDNAALFRNGNDIHVLMAYLFKSSDYEGNDKEYNDYQVLESVFNNETGDIVLDLVMWVDYFNTTGDYCCRMKVHGNEKSHHFTMTYVKANGYSKYPAVSMVGTGVSKSDDPSDYFLIKIKRNMTYKPSYTEARYYKFSCSANEDSLRAYPDTGYALTDIEDPRSYSSILDTMAMFDVDGADNLWNLDGLRNKSIELIY